MTVGGPTITLSNGVAMPRVGLGTWQVSFYLTFQSLLFQSTPQEVKAAVTAAIDAGYRLIDTAAVYQNEEAIGEAIREAIAAGKVTRDELFITTKLWANDFNPKNSEGACRDSLKRLGLDHVDLYLAHVPAAFNVRVLFYYVMPRLFY